MKSIALERPGVYPVRPPSAHDGPPILHISIGRLTDGHLLTAWVNATNVNPRAGRVWQAELRRRGIVVRREAI
jgi:hypothetical protein